MWRSAHLLKFSRLAGIGLIANVCAAGAAFVLQVVLARLLGPDAYGAYSYTMAWVAAGVVFCKLGLDSASLRYVPQYLVKEDVVRLSAFLRWSLVVPLTLALVIAVAGISLAAGAGSAVGNAVAYGLLLLPLVVVAEMLGARLQALKRMPAYLLVFGVGRPGLVIVIVLVVYASGIALGVEVALLATAVAVGLLSVILLGLGRVSPAPQGASSKLPAPEAQEWASTCLPLWVIGLSQLALARADVLVVGAFFSAREVGIYAVANQVAALVAFGLTATNQIMAPTIAELHARNDRAALQEALRNSARLVLGFSVIVTTVLWLGSESILRVFGPAFVDGATVMLILTVGQVALAYFGPVGFLLTMTGNERDASKVIVVSAIAHVCLCSALAAAYGVVGAAVGAVVAQIARSAVLTVLVSRRLHVNPRPF